MELLAPVGDRLSFYQAINSGADAVYLAGKKFGARAYAANFNVDELKEIITEAHILGVKVYITVNTIIKEKEMSDAINFIKEVANFGADAFIMQDLGLISVVRKTMPSVVIHASTNLSANCVSKVKELAKLGVKRVILARELSYLEIEEIKNNTSIELEIFIHGAQCMSYSGRCLLSSAIGKRSGNRGTCAQACRMEYRLLEDGNELKRKYYLSPRDLCTIEHIDKLKELGITSLKIEGRMKRSEYIGIVTRSYRKALDNDLTKEELASLKKEMALMFNRGYSKGYLFGADVSHFTNTASSSHIGISIGEVVKFSNNYAYIKLASSLQFGDSIRIVGKMGDAITVNEMFVNGLKKKEAKAGDLIQIRCHNMVSVGSNVIKTTDNALIESANNTNAKQIEVNGKLYFDGQVKLMVSDGVNEVIAASCFPYTKAEKEESIGRLIEQIKKTQSTHYVFNKVEVIDSLFLPIKDINELRRNALNLLDEARSRVNIVEYNPPVKEQLDINITNDVYYLVESNEQAEYLLARGKKVLTRDLSVFSCFKDKGIIYIPKRINKDGYFNSFVDCYHNCLNAASLAYYFGQGSEVVGVSVEASIENIKDMIRMFEANYLTKPNLCVQIYGREELMVMKHCLICKEKGHQEKGCGECKNHSYSLVDRVGEKYSLINDGNCNLIMLHSKVLNLINKINELKEIGVTNFLVDLKDEDVDLVEKIVNAIDESSQIHFNNETLGYLYEEVI